MWGGTKWGDLEGEMWGLRSPTPRGRTESCTLRILTDALTGAHGKALPVEETTKYTKYSKKRYAQLCQRGRGHGKHGPHGKSTTRGMRNHKIRKRIKSGAARRTTWLRHSGEFRSLRSLKWPVPSEHYTQTSVRGGVVTAENDNDRQSVYGLIANWAIAYFYL